MSSESHERARKVLQTARVEGISPDDRHWLDSHLAKCRECVMEAAALDKAIDSLHVLTVGAPAEMVRRTSFAVRQRAEQRRSQREPNLLLWVAAATSSVWAILTTPFMWTGFAWLGRMLQVPDMVWQLGFFMWWFLPATVLAGVAGWRHVVKGGRASNAFNEVYWRSL